MAWPSSLEAQSGEVKCEPQGLVDMSYLSRFWTSFECWLSMQRGTSVGLQPGGVCRYTFVLEEGAKGGQSAPAMPPPPPPLTSPEQQPQQMVA